MATRHDIFALRNTALRVLLPRIDSQKGEHLLKVEQDRAVTQWLSETPVERFEGTAKVPHDAATIRSLLVRMVQSEQKPPPKGQKRKGVNDLFTSGVEIFTPQFLQVIDYQQGPHETLETHQSLPSSSVHVTTSTTPNLQTGANALKPRSTQVTASRSEVEEISTKTAPVQRKRTIAAVDADEVSDVEEVSRPANKSLTDGTHPRKKPRKKRIVDPDSSPEPPDNVGLVRVPSQSGKTSKKRKASEDDLEQEGIASKKLKVTTQSTESSIPATPAQHTSPVPPDASPKRKAAELDSAVEDGARKKLKVTTEPTEPSKPATQAQRDTPVSPVVSPKRKAAELDTEHAESTIDQSKRQQVDTSSNGTTTQDDHQNTSDQLEERVLTLQDLDKGCRRAPRHGAQAKHAKKLLEADATLFPPELKERGRTTLDAAALRTMGSNQIEKAMDALSSSTRKVATEICIDNNLDLNAASTFVQHPEKELAALYAKIFGTVDWKAKWLDWQHSQRGYKFPMERVISALIGASVHAAVFCSTPAWDMEKSFLEATGANVKYWREALDDKGHNLEEVLKQVCFKQIKDPSFQDSVVKDRANQLANDLAMTLMPHLLLLKRGVFPREENLRINSDPVGATWIEQLRKLFRTALVVKGKIESAWDTDYEYVWFEPSSAVNPHCVEFLVPTKDPQEVVLSWWPAVRGHMTLPDGTKQTSWAHGQAVTRNREDGSTSTQP